MTVLNLTQMPVGLYATMLLTDMGANMIKIEPPQGNSTRSNLPHRYDDEAYSGYFHSGNHNKCSVVDLKTNGRTSVLRRLASDADTLVENYRKETMGKLGVTYEELREG